MTYTIQTNTKQIPLVFGTWSLARFCELNGNLSFTGMQELFQSDVSFKHIISLILCGAEHSSKKQGVPFEYTDIDAAEWIDEMGGVGSKKCQDLLMMIGKTINPDIQGVEVLKGKKKAAKK